MQTVMVELPRWLYYCMAVNIAISGTMLVFKIVEAIERH